MPLISLWESNPDAVGEFTIEQVVTSAGDGNLRDGTLCAQELQEYLRQVTSDRLAKYAEQCLTSKFDKGGMVLQDLVNELGRRLDYKVTNGRYQGTTNAIGFDGLWIAPEGNAIVAEVKTTDAYRISLDTLVSYRRRLLESQEVAAPPSILIIVGRQDTGELEAQVRGSRHAWDIRLISVEALIKLVQLKENSDEPETGGKIRSVLTPLEYTRLDQLVDIMFTTATDVEPTMVDEEEEEVSTSAGTARPGSGTWEFTDTAVLQHKRSQIVDAVGGKLGKQLIKKRRALYWSPDHSARVACTISKRYTKKSARPYWYAYHPQWDEFLKEGSERYLALGCIDLDRAFVIPIDKLLPILPSLYTTQAKRGTYWHLYIVETATGGYELPVPGADGVDLAPFTVQLESAVQRHADY